MSEMSYMFMNLQEFDKEISKVTAIRTRKSIQMKMQEKDKPVVVREVEVEKSDSSGEDDQKDHDNLSQQIEILNVDDLVKKPKEELLKDFKIREIRTKITDTFKNICKCNRKFALLWLTKTDNGRIWLSKHQKSIILNAENYDEEYKD